MYYSFIKRERKAVAMIELIFAIVVMGIVLLSIPNLINVATSSGFISLKQEAIATASSQLNLIMSKHWDENNTVEGPILKTLSTTSGLPTAQRAGRVTRAIVTSAAIELNATLAIKLGPESNDTFDDMDDADGSIMTLRDYNVTDISHGDIIDTNITISTSVTYASDVPAGVKTYDGDDSIVFNITSASQANSTNIKYISTHLSTKNIANELEKDIRLNAFSCNIGTYLPDWKDL